ncbi:MAG: cation diffusion facilitator family transporter [Phycisphaerales bacterium]
MSEPGPSSTGTKLVLRGVLLNAALVLIKGVTGVVGHSAALVADAIESAADVAGSLVTWFGLRLAERPADENHPYGHGKYEPLTALLVAGMLFGAAVLIVVEAAGQIIRPHHAPAPFTLVVLVVVVVVKEVMARVVAQSARASGSVAVAADSLHHRSDAITSAAAFIGITVALIGGPGWERSDDIAAIVAAGVIVVNAVRLARPALSELLDEAPQGTLESLVLRTASAEAGVLDAHKCRVRKIGTDLWVDLHVHVAAEMSVRESHALAHRVKDRIRAAEPKIVDVLIHIEPANAAA